MYTSGRFAVDRVIERRAEPFQVTLAATIERDRKRRSEAETDSFRSQGRFRGTKSELELLYEKQGPEVFIEVASKIFGP